MKKLIKYRGRKAVSPVVATLILIIVAIVGAVAVGLIVSGIGTQTSKNANVGNADSQAQTQILVGGSTTAYPAVEAAATAYGAANGVNIQVQQGGGGAGMTGVAEGVLNIGVAGSTSNVVSAISNFPSANLQAFEVGGTADVFIANFGATSTPASGPCSGDQIVAISQGALESLYGSTDGGYGSPTCTLIPTTTTYEITAFGLGTPGTLSSSSFGAVSRSDLPSGAEDTVCSYLSSANDCSATSNNVQPLPGITETGDAGILSEVTGHEYTIGFVAIGYAEGAVATPGSTSALADETILTVVSSSDATLQPAACAASLPASPTLAQENCYALPLGTAGALDSYIKASLSNTSPSSTSPVFPDATSGTGLTRTLWFVTAGAPATDEQAFITYIRSPAAQSFWNNAGIYSLYQLTPITPP